MKYETEDIIPVVIMGNLKDLTTQKAKSKVYKKLALDEVQCLYSKGANIFPKHIFTVLFFLFCFNYSKQFGLVSKLGHFTHAPDRL